MTEQIIAPSSKENTDLVANLRALPEKLRTGSVHLGRHVRLLEDAADEIERLDKLASAISRDCNNTALERNQLRDDLARARAEPSEVPSKTLVDSLLMEARSALRQSTCPSCNRSGYYNKTDCETCRERTALCEKLLHTEIPDETPDAPSPALRASAETFAREMTQAVHGDDASESDMRRVSTIVCESMSPAETSEGYSAAFYQIAELLGLSAMPVSPREAFETVMLPKLCALVKKSGETEVAPSDAFREIAIKELREVEEIIGERSEALALIGLSTRPSATAVSETERQS